ncbi:MAG TPA: hypothetical protein VFU98_09860 [Microlunatus sp.]|nr:hypothetical protein [Microlunatus sp.]
MRPRVRPSDELRALAAAQAGVVSADQTIFLRLPQDSRRRLLDDGEWRLLTRGVYYLGLGTPTWMAHAWAGVLVGGVDARLGFAAAGHLWGLVADPPTEIPVLVPATRQVAARECWTFPRERRGVRSAKSPGLPPRTTVADTVVDLSDVDDESGLVDLVTRAVQSRLVGVPELRQVVRSRRRLRHRQRLLALLGDVGEGAESALELRYLTDVERAHGLPQGVRQRRSRSGTEMRDVLYEQQGTIVELDGAVHAMSCVRDMRRDNRALLDGQVSLRYGWADVTGSPCHVAWQVAAILVSRGWTGFPVRCRRCANTPDAALRFV